MALYIINIKIHLQSKKHKYYKCTYINIKMTKSQDETNKQKEKKKRKRRE